MFGSMEVIRLLLWGIRVLWSRIKRHRGFTWGTLSFYSLQPMELRQYHTVEGNGSIYWVESDPLKRVLIPWHWHLPCHLPWHLTAYVWGPRKGLGETGHSVQAHLISEAVLSWVMGCCRRTRFLWGPPHVCLHGRTSRESIHSSSAGSFLSPSMVTPT